MMGDPASAQRGVNVSMEFFTFESISRVAFIRFSRGSGFIGGLKAPGN